MTLDLARKLALSLPESNEEPHHELSSFRVHGKIFATVPPDGEHLHIFVDEPTREAAIAAEPGAIEALHWGKKIMGVRLTLAKTREATVAALLRSAWQRVAAR